MHAQSGFGKSIAVVDLGGQYCHMISRRLRDIGIWSDIFPSTASAKELSRYSGIILSGGPQSVYDKNAPAIDRHMLDLELPILGICYGHQLLARELGADVVPASAEEFGPSELELQEADTIFSDTPRHQLVWMSHSDAVRELPKGATLLASTKTCDVAAFAMGGKYFGVQFHPEVSHTSHGSKILSNFAIDVCGIEATWKGEDRVERLTQQIRSDVGEKSVFFLVSGGVDSTVAFSLCARALPRGRVLGVYVDTGLMRENETSELKSLLGGLGMGRQLKVLDKSKDFLAALAGQTDPEEKRKIIGRKFIQVQAEACHEYGIDKDNWLIGQGTIYPDTIESGGGGGATALIKTHHNRCDEMLALIKQGRVIEPLREFYKDEVREIGAELGLPPHLTQRWPFPGPGLAIRCLCTNDSSSVAPAAALYSLPERLPHRAVSLPIRTVGVQGDGRTYRAVIAVEGPKRYSDLKNLCSELCSVGKAHNRVIFRLAGADNLEDGRVLLGMKLTPERLATLRAADRVVSDVMTKKGLMEAVWQFPVVMIPVAFDAQGNETIIFRPVNSEDGMTARFSELPFAVLDQMAQKVMAIPGVGAVFLDVSDKPPATIEWE